MTFPVLAAVRLASISGAPADDVENEFVFNMNTFDSDDADDIATALMSFYNTVQVIPGEDLRVCSFLNATVSRAIDAVEIRMYDLTGHLDGSDHGSPDFVRNGTLEIEYPGESAIPNECAVRLSIHASQVGVLEKSGDTRPRGRRRGGVFIGPLNTKSVAISGGNAVVATPLRDTLTVAATELLGALDNGWSVWSRTDAVIRPVVGGWVDNAFDTIRKRGHDYTVRTVFPV